MLSAASLSLPRRALAAAPRARRALFVAVRTAASTVPPPLAYADASAQAHAAAALELSFRRFGHLESALDPLDLSPRAPRPELATPHPSLSAHAARLRAAFCGPLGAEFEHCASAAERDFFASRLLAAPGGTAGAPGVAAARNAARAMLRADAFEHFLAVKWPTLKRYGVEGIEALLPAVEWLVAAAGAAGVRDVVIAQAHRGRLALLVAGLGFPARRLFRKLAGASAFPPGVRGVDDVTSHLFHSTRLGPVAVSLLPNPSHLEAVNAVALGKVRAKRDAAAGRGGGGGGGGGALALIIHGDAAAMGQGVVAEGYLLSALPGFAVGGAIHLVCNNQLGFTAGERAGRSSEYASDAAKTVGAPVLHVRADALGALARAVELAVAYRAAFARDVVIDLVGFRRHGHNEVDEPSFTSPAMYARIARAPPLAHAFAAALDAAGAWPAAEAAAYRAKALAALEAEFAAAAAPAAEDAPAGDSPVLRDGSAFGGKWRGMRPAASDAELLASPPTGAPLPLLRAVGAASVTLPAGFTAHPRLLRGHVAPRLAALAPGADAAAPSLDWATAEALAFGAVLADGGDVRLCGQDSQRGTFSHRHAVLVDQHPAAAEATTTPLNDALPAALAQLLPAPARRRIGRLHAVSSPLSEFAVLGFEYGYSSEDPRALCLWEAQFGDFANAAQVVIDTFVASGESKWLRQSGLVLLLPHGQDGAGPEHSSARIERFLQLANAQAAARDGGAAAAAAARDGDATAGEPANLLVAQPSTPANYFHLLRRQLARPLRKPLVVIAPKTLLRLAAARSALAELGPGTAFQPLLAEPRAPADAGVTRAILCSGRLYYELAAARDAARDAAAAAAAPATPAAALPALLRVEELAPFPADALLALCRARYPRLARIDWAQEEPANAGAWTFAEAHLAPLLASAGLPPLRLFARPALAAPAVGLAQLHKRQERTLMARIMAG